jgi:hypothetical protein
MASSVNGIRVTTVLFLFLQEISYVRTALQSRPDYALCPEDGSGDPSSPVGCGLGRAVEVVAFLASPKSIEAPAILFFIMTKYVDVAVACPHFKMPG